MSIKNIISPKKYLNKIYLWVTLGMFLVLIVFSGISYYNVQNEILKNEYTANRKILNQIKFNINYMDDMLVSVCFSTYYNSNVRNLINNANIDFGEVTKEIETIKTSIVNTNPFIQSIYIYNRQIGKYYTTLDGVIYEDASLNKLIKSYEEVPKLVPVYRKLNLTDGNTMTTKNVFTYFMYEFMRSDGYMDGAVIVNCNSDWLLRNIRELNMVDKNGQDEIFIMDNDGNFIGDPGNDIFYNSLKLRYKDYIKNSADKTAGIFESDINGKKYLITFTNVENAKWVIIKTQPYSLVFESVNKIKTVFIVITLIFIILSFILSLKITKSIYNPIGKLVGQLRTGNIPIDNHKAKDEISYLSEVYEYSLEKLNEYKSEKMSDKGIVKSYFLRKLLVDSYSVSTSEFRTMIKEKEVTISNEAPFIVCVIKIDDYKKYIEKYNEEDRDIYRFAIINITSEILSGKFKNEAIDLKSDQIVIIMNVDSETGDLINTIKELIKQAQKFIFNYYKIKVSASISSCSNDTKELTRLYNEALNTSMYRLIFESETIITQDMVKQNIENQEIGYKAALERKLMQEIKVGNIEKSGETVNSILKEISRLSYSNIVLALLQLINSLKATVDEINAQRFESVYIDFNLLAREIFELESLDELQAKIMKLLKAVIDRSGSVENEKQTALAEAVKEIINANYFDSGLYLPEISSRLNMSAKHIARVFKTVTDMTVTEYINEVRLKKAVEWLENSKLSIHEIISKIGIDNESYFYKLFKMKYGVTPREYTLNKNFKKS
ncbi:AraC family transcriptional regulator [Ruminiclostridium cellobioparum]|uniref:AraC-type DNA-binding domain-containing protein n=1 Tax=Ruminiclostridium cellobioparum subsp. termitidis CT1112 TaxID=1195236 RepID=S0FIV5_RUMCE|nr:AraC family transcriptional regulator [Ruminiclostridium cellobioparum]EMS69034.1 AraC-type DNA-binding domain-containing protein [Ruminiclostridium cellobioparum subsp. termitidis CT1112]